MKILFSTAMLAAMAIWLAQAEPRHREHKDKHHNYIIERQQAYQVQGPPTIAPHYRQAPNRRLSAAQWRPDMVRGE